MFVIPLQLAHWSDPAPWVPLFLALVVAGGTWAWTRRQRLRIAGSAADQRGLDQPPAKVTDPIDRREVEAQQRRQLELQCLATRILESFIRAEDLDAAIGSLLSLVGPAFAVSRGTFIAANPDGTGSSVRAEWNAPGVESAVARRTAVDPASIRWWIETAQAGLPFSVCRDELYLPAQAGAPLHPDTQSLLIVPVLVSGQLRGALVFEDLREPRKWRAEELAIFQTLGFAAARGLEQQAAAEERSRLEAVTQQLERSELAAQLASGVAHDFNNILFAIGGHVQLLRMRLLNSEVSNTLSEIEQVIESASTIVSGLLQAHRGDAEPPRPLNAASELRDATELAGRLLPRSMRVETRIGSLDEARVRSTPQGLRQLVLNLLVNARDALGGSGRAVVQARQAAHPTLGECVLVEVADSGPGIPESKWAEALKPFYTTKGAVGTGLGLPICQRVAFEAGGLLELGVSAELGGLLVRTWLPVVDAEIGPCVASKQGGDRTGPMEPERLGVERLSQVYSVLVIEDDDAVREVLRSTFHALDIDVVVRSHADELEALVAEGPVPYDFLVMDIDLPGRSGIEALRSLRERGVRLPCLFVTGGPSEPPASLAPFRLLRKPFRIEALLHAARSLHEESKATSPVTSPPS